MVQFLEFLSSFYIIIGIPLFTNGFMPIQTKLEYRGFDGSKEKVFRNDIIQMQASKDENVILNRRNVLLSTSAFALAFLRQDTVSASGGATAGKYTTIPIAKRRYYGRVQEAVHEFLLMAPDVVKGDMSSSTVQKFFDVTATVIIPAQDFYINGQCTKKGNICKGAEIRDSRYNDMKTSMYLLGNAFRYDQSKPPDKLPTVRAAKAFFKEIDNMEKLVVKNPKKDVNKAQASFVKSLDILDTYLDLVELPPTDSGHYDQEFDTLVGKYSRIT